MAEILFPTSPVYLEEYTHPTTQTVYVWNNTQWRIKASVDAYGTTTASYRLPSTEDFLPVENPPLETQFVGDLFSVYLGSTNVIVIDYSIADIPIGSNTLREGRVSIKAVADEIWSITLDDEYTENRTNINNGDFTFGYSIDGSMLTLTYKHNFGSDIGLMTFTKKWSSPYPYPLV